MQGFKMSNIEHRATALKRAVARYFVPYKVRLKLLIVHYSLPSMML